MFFSKVLSRSSWSNRGVRRIPWVLSLGLLLSAPAVWAAWPTTLTVFDDPLLPVESIGVAQHGGEHWFVAELWDDDPAVRSGQVYLRRHTPGVGLSALSNVGNDPGGFDRLDTPGRHALPSIAMGSNSAVNLSMQADALGFGPTIENPVVNSVTGRLVLNPPRFIDDDSARTADRGRSGIAINDVLGQVWSCWTYHKPGNDDVYCRGRQSGPMGFSWPEPILALATTAVIEDHPSVALQSSTARRVVAYHTSTGIKVRLFDSSNTEDGSNDVALGGTANVNFPHLIDVNGVLHTVAVHTVNQTLQYATCSANCHVNANWSRETLDDTTAQGDQVAHPQVAVDAAGHVFVAFQHTPAGQGAAGERVKVTAKCATDGWDNDGGVPIDDTEEREQLGGHLMAKALPAFVFDDTHNQLSVTYVQAVSGTPRLGRWAQEEATTAFNDICAGQ